MKLKAQDIVYYARIIPNVNVYEVSELRIRTATDNWYVGVDTKDKQAIYFQESDIDSKIFLKRSNALTVVKNAEKNIIKEKREDINEEDNE